jgi:hypothetical protein
MIVKESNDTTRINRNIQRKIDETNRNVSERSDCNSSRVKWINKRKRRIEEDVAQSKRRTNMIVELRRPERQE